MVGVMGAGNQERKVKHRKRQPYSRCPSFLAKRKHSHRGGERNGNRVGCVLILNVGLQGYLRA